jgi:hypothetical protein
VQLQQRKDEKNAPATSNYCFNEVILLVVDALNARPIASTTTTDRALDAHISHIEWFDSLMVAGCDRRAGRL